MKPMIRFLHNNEIDMHQWDACIEKSPNGLAYAYSWYLNRVAPGWGALVEGSYDTVMPLPIRKKAGVQYVYQPHFVQQLGVFGKNSHQEEVCDRFMEAVLKKFAWVDYHLNSHNMLSRTSHICKPQRGVTHLLDLVETYEQLRAGYSRNTRRNLAKATRKGVFILKSANPQEIIDAFRLNKGKSLGVFGPKDYATLKHLIYQALQLGLVQIYSAYDARNSFCGGIVMMQNHHKAVLLFTGSTDEALENGAMFALIDDYIRQNAGKVMVLDFEGSLDENLARFYKGFGSKECVFLRVKYSRLPFGAEALLQVARFIRRYLSKCF